MLSFDKFRFKCLLQSPELGLVQKIPFSDLEIGDRIESSLSVFKGYWNESETSPMAVAIRKEVSSVGPKEVRLF